MSLVPSVEDTAEDISRSLLKNTANVGLYVVDRLINTGFLMRSAVLLNAKNVSVFVGKVMAHTCKVFGYRAIGTIEQQIFTTSTPFSTAPIVRYRTTVPYTIKSSCESLEELPAKREIEPIDKEMCSVCLEVFDRFDRCFMAPCRHVFHTHCILHWIHFSSEFSCPVCRLDMYCPDRQAYYATKTFTTILDLYDFIFTADFFPIGKTLQLPQNVQSTKN